MQLKPRNAGVPALVRKTGGGTHGKSRKAQRRREKIDLMRQV